jgi:hypothetical protein
MRSTGSTFVDDMISRSTKNTHIKEINREILTKIGAKGTLSR